MAIDIYNQFNMRMIEQVKSFLTLLRASIKFRIKFFGINAN